jgi:ankyrin repeat protein
VSTPGPLARTLRSHPDLDQLKRQAKELLAAFRRGDADAVAIVHAHYRHANPDDFALSHAQLVLSRAYGFDSWPKLKAYVDGVTMARLADAVRANDVAGVRGMLAARPELARMDRSEHDEHRALHYAVLARSPEMVRLLMRHGADPRKGIYPHREATSAFAMAADREYGDILAILREEDERRAAAATTRPASTAQWPSWEGPLPPDAEARALAMLEATPQLVHAIVPGHRGTALHVAAAMLWPRLLTWLLDHGADPNAPGRWGATPLELAGCAVDADPVALRVVTDTLLARGAAKTPRWAIATGDIDWLRARRAENALENHIDERGGLLRAAAAYGRLDILHLLLDYGFDPDERARVKGLEEPVYSWGEPLRKCAITGRLDLAAALLERGADPNTAVYAASSALLEAYQRGNAAMIALIERHGGILDAGATGALGLIDHAEQLLADEASGRLHERAVPPGSTVAQELLWSGADSGRPAIVRLALSHVDWPRDDTRWHEMLRRVLGEHPEPERARYVECFRLTLERCDASVRGGTYRATLLHDVSGSWPYRPSSPPERVVLATMLLDAGAAPDVRDAVLMSTPLGWACRWGRVEMVRLLLSRGADPVEADAEPWATPRAWARKGNHAEILALLG